MNFRLLTICLLSSFIFLSCSSPSVPLIPSASPGDILYQEDFEDRDSGWDRVSNDNGIMDYDGGGYRMLVQRAGYNIWSTPEKNFTDVRVEVDVFKLSGPSENRTGLMCRYQNGDYYFFIIGNDGFYAIGKYIGGQTLLLGQSEMQSTEVILKEAVNHLRADCVGDKLTFYVNYTEVASAQDSDFANGDVGLLTGAFGEPGVDVLFDHLVVMQP
jgi:hypothetical protein